MKTTQIKFQKPIVLATVITAAVSVFYALMFATQLYGFDDAFAISGVGYEGIELFESAQPFNRALFALSVAYLIVSLSLLVFFTQSRRNYYLSNYISSSVTAAFGVGLSVYSLVNIFITMGKFTAIDFEAINEVLTDPELQISPMTPVPWTFIIGIILYIAIIALCVCLIVNLVWKHKEMKRDKAEYAEIDAQIRAEWAKHEEELKQEESSYES